MNPEPESKSITLERIIHAPAELIYSAWIEPSHVERWWGPNGFTTHSVVIDARPGGAMSYVMRAPDGTEYPCRGEFIEVERNRKLTVRSAPLDEQGQPVVWVVNSMELFPEGASTRLVLTATAEATDSPAAIAMLAGMREGWSQSLDRMLGFAEGEGRFEIVASRLISAPTKLAYEAFADPVNISHWWGPEGFRTTTHSMDFRVGGEWLFTMHGPDGTDYPNKVVYTTLDREARIAYDHGSPEQFPMFRAEIRFDALPGGTRVTLLLIAPTVEFRDYMAGFGAIEGAHDTLRRLSLLLEECE